MWVARVRNEALLSFGLISLKLGEVFDAIKIQFQLALALPFT